MKHIAFYNLLFSSMRAQIYMVQSVMKHAVEHYFGGGSELLNMHERLADLLLIALSSSFEDVGKI